MLAEGPNPPTTRLGWKAYGMGNSTLSGRIGTRIFMLYRNENL